VLTLLADVNIEGHIRRLVARMQGNLWLEFWELLQLRSVNFRDIGLDPATTDALIWRHCQDHRLLLLTSNRNDDGPDSLEAAIRTHNTPQSLPVFTIADADNILSGTDYADRVIDRLFRYLLELDNVRGTGRLYLP
jgi:hypothetical protein